MVERRPGVTPPEGRRRPPRPEAPRRRVHGRRIAALAALAVAGLGVYGGVRIAGRSSAPPPPPTVAPPPKPFRVVFPEGFTRADMAERVAAVAKIAERKRHEHVRLSRRAYLAASGPRVVPGFGAKRRSLEGFLFPATYDFLAATRSSDLVRAQLQAFRRNWKQVDLSYARSKNLTPYDVLIIASMVERETAAPSERRLVAAVIYNRLHAGMTLGIDATIRYGLHVPGTRPLLQSQLESDNPYNTRKFAGLPPTPIANPGLAAIQAAAHPAKVDYLYYVRKPDRRHHYFTASYQDFVNHELAYGYR